MGCKHKIVAKRMVFRMVRILQNLMQRNQTIRLLFLDLYIAYDDNVIRHSISIAYHTSVKDESQLRSEAKPVIFHDNRKRTIKGRDFKHIVDTNVYISDISVRNVWSTPTRALEIIVLIVEYWFISDSRCIVLKSLKTYILNHLSRVSSCFEKAKNAIHLQHTICSKIFIGV